MEIAKKVFETERLVLREFDLEDAEFIVELLNTPGWLKFIGDKKVNSLEDARNYIERNLLKSYKTHGFGFWMVELKFVSVPIGLCGLIKRETLDNVDIGFAMLPDFAGFGYGYESAKATFDYARDEVGLKRIIGITLENNTASIKLLEKIGLKYEKLIDGFSDGEKLMLFGVDF